MLPEIKIGKGDIAEALAHVAASFAEIEKQRDEEQKNTREFCEAVGKLAKKHKVMYFLQAFDKNASVTRNEAKYTEAINYGFESLHDFAHAVQSSAKDLSETAFHAALAAGMLVEEHCPDKEEESDEGRNVVPEGSDKSE